MLSESCEHTQTVGQMHEKSMRLQGCWETQDKNTHTRAMPSEVLERQAHWPFHLAGDYGVRLFNHRAWVSWRLLALLELPSLTLWDLPIAEQGFASAY